MRQLCAAALSLTLTFGLWLALSSSNKPVAAAPAPDEKSDRTDKLAERKKKYDETFKEFEERLKAAAPADQRGIISELKEETQLMASKVLPIAEASPKDEIAFDAVSFIVEKASIIGANGPDVEKAVAIIAEHHATNAKVKDFLIPAMRMGPTGEKLLKAVAEKATDKDTKATALFINGYMLAQNAENEEDEKKLAELVKQATQLMEEAKKLSPDTKLGKGSQTIGKLATSEIEGLKTAATVSVGNPAPEVVSKLLDGKDVKLSEYRGKVVMLDIWATWCGPCKAMIPHERKLVEKMKDKPFVLVSVSADKEKEALEKFLEKEPMPWIHWWNDGPESEVLKKYRVKAFPTMYIIDHTGKIKHKWVGNPGDEKIDAAIEELVKEAIKAKG